MARLELAVGGGRSVGGAADQHARGVFQPDGVLDVLRPAVYLDAAGNAVGDDGCDVDVGSLAGFAGAEHDGFGGVWGDGAGEVGEGDFRIAPPRVGGDRRGRHGTGSGGRTSRVDHHDVAGAGFQLFELEEPVVVGLDAAAGRLVGQHAAAVFTPLQSHHQAGDAAVA